MTNLEQLKKEAREKYKKTLSLNNVVMYSADSVKTVDFLDTLIDHIHAATVEECIGVMPEESYDTDGHGSAASGRNEYRDEAISRLQALITEPGV